MAYGIQTFRDNGSVILDSGTVGGVFMEVVTMSAASSGSKTYPRAVGGSLYAYTLVAGNHTVTFSTNTSGQGVMTWAPASGSNAAESKYAVFAKKLTAADIYGLNIVNNADEVLIDSQFPVPQYLGSAQSTASGTGVVLPSGDVRYTFLVDASVIAAMGFNSDRIIMIAMPDNGTADVWYSQGTTFMPSGNNAISAAITVVAPQNVSFLAPGIYVYSLNKPPTGTTGMGLQVYDGANIIFSAATESLSVKQFANITAPANNASSTYSVAFPSLPAVVLPRFARATPAGDGTDYHTLMYKRVGTTLTVKMVLTDHTASVFITYEYGIKTGAYKAVIDVSGLGYLTSSYTPSPQAPPDSAPVITEHPASTGNMSEGQTMTLNCAATGVPAPTYVWRRNGVDITSPSSSGGYSRVLGANDFTGDSYTCYVNNGVGQVLSNAAILTITHPTANPPVITQQPVNASTTQNGTASFTIVASPVQTYQWYSNGLPGEGTPSATQATYYPLTMFGGTQTIYCIVSANGFSVQSNTVTLTVGPNTSPPVISTQPQNVSTAINVNVALTCEASPVTGYEWFLNGVTTNSGGSSYMPPTHTAGSSTVYCVCSNNGTTTTSNTVTFTVTGGGGGGGGTTPYPSYNNTSSDAFTENSDADFYYYANGTTDGAPWANGTGDGSLYQISASLSSGSYVPSSGSGQLDTWYPLTAKYGIIPPSNAIQGASRSCILSLSIKLTSNSQVVCTHSLTLNSTYNFQ